MKFIRLPFPIICITALGIFLRLYRLGFESLWYDEVCSYDFASMTLGDIFHGRNGMDTPPLYIFLLRPWIMFGPQTDWWIRFLSAIFGCLSMWPAYIFGKRLFGKSSALLIYYMLFALSGILVVFSQEARMYALLILLTLLVNIFCFRLMDHPTKRNAMALALLTGAVIYAHTLAALHIISLGFVIVFWVMQNRAESLARCKIFLFYIAVTIPCLLPTLAYLNDQSRSIPWIEMVNQGKHPMDLAWSAFSRFVLEFGAPIDQHLRQTLATILLLMACLGLTIPLLRHYLRDRASGGSAETGSEKSHLPTAMMRLLHLKFPAIFTDQKSWLMVMMTTLMPCLLLLVISTWNPLFLDRYLLYSVPSLLAAVAAGMAWIPQPRLREIAVVVFGIVFLGNNLFLAHSRQKNDSRRATEEMLLNYKPGQMVAFLPGHEMRWFKYYSRGHHVSTFAFPVDTDQEFSKAIDQINLFEKNYETLWVFYNYPGLTDTRQVIPKLLDSTYPRILIRQYGLNLFLVGYDLNNK